MPDRLFPMPDKPPWSPRQHLYLRMIEWLVFIPGTTLVWAQKEAAKWARASLDPQRDLDMMRDIERTHGPRK